MHIKTPGASLEKEIGSTGLKVRGGEQIICSPPRMHARPLAPGVPEIDDFWLSFICYLPFSLPIDWCYKEAQGYQEK